MIRNLFLFLLLLSTGMTSFAQTSAEQIKWSMLLSEDFSVAALQKKFAKEIDYLQTLPDDSEEGQAIIDKIQAELNKAPINKKHDGKYVKMAGFIAPLDTANGMIDRFLLVPYFGACIHVPPPPINQTVLVEALPKKGVKLHQAEYPFWVEGKMQAIGEKTSIGEAGYRIIDATTRPIEDDEFMDLSM